MHSAGCLKNISFFENALYLEKCHTNHNNPIILHTYCSVIFDFTWQFLHIFQGLNFFIWISTENDHESRYLDTFLARFLNEKTRQISLRYQGKLGKALFIVIFSWVYLDKFFLSFGALWKPCVYLGTQVWLGTKNNDTFFK